MLKHILTPCLLAGVLFGHPIPGFAQPSVVTSIKPLQLIATAVMDGAAQPAVLIPSNQSPHHYVLRPSDVALVNDADVLLWVGGNLETYLSSLFSGADNTTVVLEAASLSGILLQAPGGARLMEIESRYDAHLWLNSDNALVIAEHLVAELVRLDSSNAGLYQQNLAAFRTQIAATRELIEVQLAPMAGIPYAVFHDGVQYFERQFGLQHQFVVAPDHENQPGIRHLVDIRTQIAQTHPACLLEDVNASDATVTTVFEDVPVKRVRIDPLGELIKADEQGYASLLSALADAFDTCRQAR